MNDYKVTIAVPVYGVESYVEKCAISLFEQTYSNLEILFINDCTPDKSVEIINKTLEKYPHRKAQVKIYNQPVNKGCPTARNLAVQIATGDFILFVDGDDYIEIDSISSLVTEQIASNADLVVAHCLIETNDSTYLLKYCDMNKTKEDIIKDCLDDKASQSVCGILIKKVYILITTLRRMRASMLGKIGKLLHYYYTMQKIAYVDKVIYHYQLSRSNSITITSQESVTKKKNQLICFVKTMNCLLRSFKNKGQTYLDIIYRKKAILVQDAMIYCCKDRDEESFKILVLELKSIDQKYLSALGNTNPLVLRMKRIITCYPLFCILIS